MKLKHIPQGSHATVSCVLTLNRRVVAKHTATAEEIFQFDVDLSTHEGRHCQAEIRSDSFFVPRHIHNTPDERPLSVQLLESKIANR